MKNVEKIRNLGIGITCLLASGLWLGCSGEHSDIEQASHGHYHAAPHGGALAMLGDHLAQLELVAGPKPGEWSLYVLDGGAERFVRVEQTEVQVAMDGQNFVFQAVANQATGETVGNTSQFSAAVEGLGKDDSFPVQIEEIIVYRQSFKDVEFVYPEGKH